MDGLEDGIDAAQFLQVVIEREVALLRLAEDLALAIRRDELQKRVLAAQRHAQGAQRIAVVRVFEKGVTRRDDVLMLFADEPCDADTERHAVKVQRAHLLKIDLIDADRFPRRLWREVEQFPLPLLEMHIQPRHLPHPVAEIRFVAHDNDRLAVIMVSQRLRKGLKVPFPEKRLDHR